MSAETDKHTSLGEIARLFLRLGATSFGGPAAHVAMMHDEVVKRRAWLTEERFLDLLSATNLIPGPNSTEMALHIGWTRRGLAGLVVAGVCFIAPAMLITAAIAWTYARFGTLPSARDALYGVKPVVLSVVAQAIWGLTPKAAPTNRLRALGVAAIIASACGLSELVVLALAGALSALSAPRARGSEGSRMQLVPWAPIAAGAAAKGVTLPSLFGVFLKIGSVLYGSGYVLLAFLRADLVQRRGWLTEAQLLDAVAVGQFTPGPVFTTATFIGGVLAGPSGALVATVGIFLPAFVLVALSGPLVPRLRASPTAGAVLDGVNVASLALMVVVSAQLARASLVDAPAVVLALVSAALLVRWKVNSAWLVLGGAALGVALHSLGVSVK